MSTPLPPALAAALEPVAPLPRDEEGGPVFAAPWEAQVFAMAAALHDAGVLTWSEWAQALGQAIRGSAATDGSPYAAWMTVLEGFVAREGIASDTLLAARRDAFDRAARATPHGQPILLENDLLIHRRDPAPFP